MRLNLKVIRFSTLVLTGMILLAGCATDDEVTPLNDAQIESRGLTTGFIPNTPLIGLSPNNELVNFTSGPPAQDLGVVPITGLRDLEVVLAIDTRPATKELFAVTNQNFIYIIDPETGVATPVSNIPLAPAVNGVMMGFDFDPAADVIRLIADSGQNLRISPETGAVIAIDNVINSFTAEINGSAYTYPGIGSPSKLYSIDIANAVLYRQRDPNSGQLQLVGPLAYYWSGEGGFEITRNNIAFAVQYGHSRFPMPDGGGTIGGGDDTTQDAYRLFYINLKTGLATSFGKVRPMIGVASL